MAKRKINSEHVNYIREQFEEDYPNSVPKVFIIDKVVHYLTKFIKRQLEEEKEVQIIGLGKFRARHKLAAKSKQLQWYPKFQFSRHFILSFRQSKGTATESELREIARKKDFINEVWQKRKAWMLNNIGEIPENVLRYEKQFKS